MKRMTTIVLVAAMILSMSAPATAAKTRTVKKTTTSATTPVSSEYTIKMVGNTIQFMKGGVIVRSAVTKDGKITLKKNSQGGISVIFKNKNGKMSNITFGKQDDVKLSGTFAQVAVDKTLGANSTITLEKGSKVTSFTTKGEAKILINGNVTTLNSANKKANIVVTGSVTKAYAMSKKTISGMSSSKIIVNETGTSSNSTSSSNTTDWPAYEKPSYNGGSSNGWWGGSSGGTTEEKPEEKPVTPPTPGKPTPPDDTQKPSSIKVIQQSTTNASFAEPVTIVTGGKNIKITNCTFSAGVSVVDSLGGVKGRMAKAAPGGSVSFEGSKATGGIAINSPVSFSSDATTEANKITVASGVTVPDMNIAGPVNEVALEGSVSTVTLSGRANTLVSGTGELSNLHMDASAAGSSPSGTVTAPVKNVTTSNSGTVGAINIGGTNTGTKVEIGTKVESVGVSGSAAPAVNVNAGATVDNITSSSSGKTTVSGTGTVSSADKAGNGDLTLNTTNPPTVNTITLTSIAVTKMPTKITYYVGEKLDLTGIVVTGTYSDGKTRAITTAVTSSSTISSAGTQDIVVVAETKTAPAFKVTVKAAALKSITVTPTEVIPLAIKGTKQLTSTEAWNGTEGSATIVWKSSNESVATVSDAGLVTAVGAGTANITATSGTIVSNTVSVKVLAAEEKIVSLGAVKQGSTESKLVEGKYSVVRGSDKITVEVIPSYVNANAKYSYTVKKPDGTAGTPATDQAINLATAGSAVAITLPDMASDAAAGDYVYTIIVDGKAPITITLNVGRLPGVTSVSLDTVSANVAVGGTKDIVATVGADTGVTDTAVTWKSSDTTVATVVVKAGKAGENPTATVTAVKEGTTTITATAGGVSTTATINVVPTALSTINKATTEADVANFLANAGYISDCKIELAEYAKLDAALKLKVRTAVLSGIPAKNGYADATAVKTAFDDAVTAQQKAAKFKVGKSNTYTYYDATNVAGAMATANAAKERIEWNIVGDYTNNGVITIGTNVDMIITAGTFTNPSGKSIKITESGTIKGGADTSKFVNNDSNPMGSTTVDAYKFDGSSSYTWNNSAWVKDAAKEPATAPTVAATGTNVTKAVLTGEATNTVVAESTVAATASTLVFTKANANQTFEVSAGTGTASLDTDGVTAKFTSAAAGANVTFNVTVKETGKTDRVLAVTVTQAAVKVPTDAPTVAATGTNVTKAVLTGEATNTVVAESTVAATASTLVFTKANANQTFEVSAGTGTASLDTDGVTAKFTSAAAGANVTFNVTVKETGKTDRVLAVTVTQAAVKVPTDAPTVAATGTNVTKAVLTGEATNTVVAESTVAATASTLVFTKANANQTFEVSAGTGTASLDTDGVTAKFTSAAAGANVTFNVTVKETGKTDRVLAVTVTQAAVKEPATVPTSISMTAGTNGATVGTDVQIPAAGATDTTGAITGWVTKTADQIKFTVTDASPATSTVTINGAAYTSGAAYTIAAATPLTIVVTTSESGKSDCVRTFTVSVAAKA